MAVTQNYDPPSHIFSQLTTVLPFEDTTSNITWCHNPETHVWTLNNTGYQDPSTRIYKKRLLRLEALTT